MWDEKVDDPHGKPTSTSLVERVNSVPGAKSYVFSYAKHSLNWVTDPNVGAPLVETITCLSAKSHHKVVVVAHSMGGLATQYALGQESVPADGQRVSAHVAKVVTLGTPYRGSWFLTVAQALTIGLDVGAAVGGDWHLVAAAEAMLSWCAKWGQEAHLTGARSPCDLLIAVPRSPVGRALIVGSKDLRDLTPWPDATVPRLGLAGDMQVQIPLLISKVNAAVGDLPVTVDSATAVPEKSAPAACPVPIEVWRWFTSPCFHLALHKNPTLVGAVLAAVKSVAEPPVDWANHTYSLTCAGNTPQGFTVTLREGHGVATAKRAGPYDYAEVTLERASSGDLTADNAGETAVLLSCSPHPSNFTVEDVQVFTHGGRDFLARLPTVVNAPTSQGLTGMYVAKQFKVSNGAITAPMLQYGIGDSHASGPSVPTTITWKWDGHQFQSSTRGAPSAQPPACRRGTPDTFTIGPICLPKHGYDIAQDGRGGVSGQLCGLPDCPRFRLYTGDAYRELMQGGPTTDGPFRKDASGGWSTSTDVPMCLGGSQFNGASRITASGFAPFGQKTAEYRQWTIGCTDGQTQFVTAWILPITQVALVQAPALPASVEDMRSMVRGATFR